MTIVETVEVIEDFVIYVLGIQVIYSAIVLIFGQTAVDIYEQGVFNSKHPILRAITILTTIIIGVGPILYKRMVRFPWWKQKLFMLLAVMALTIASFVIYEILSALLEFILL